MNPSRYSSSGTNCSGGKKAVLILDNGEAIDLKSTSGVELKEKDGTVIQVDSTALNYQQAPARHPKNLYIIR